MRLILIVTCLLSLAGFVPGQNSKFVKTDKIEGIICTNFDDWKGWTRATEFWTPTVDDILKAEKQIGAYLKKDSQDHSNILRRLPRYKRQYVGIIVDGHKRILCNFYCSSEPLRDKPFVVKDGGDCYFRIQYDLTDKKCYEFNVNGVA